MIDLLVQFARDLRNGYAISKYQAHELILKTPWGGRVHYEVGPDCITRVEVLDLPEANGDSAEIQVWYH